MRVLITGVAGFIGFHLARKLLKEGHDVVGVDNMNDYYSVELKSDRLKILLKTPGFSFSRMDIADGQSLIRLFRGQEISHVVNLAAQAGVRYSLSNPQAYISSNLDGFANILECCRHYPVKHLVFASSSSVYGLDSLQPYSPHSTAAGHPVSLYAATKRSGELMAHAYSHLYGIPSTGLRFFTVYGPWGRPDMALHLFVSSILADKPIRVFNNGSMSRDFTYIDDIVDGIMAILALPPAKNSDWDATKADPATSSAPWRLYNIGSSAPCTLAHFIETIEKVMGHKAKKEFLPMQPGDVLSTWADIEPLAKLTGFAPNTKLEEGIRQFWNWYQGYYGV